MLSGLDNIIYPNRCEVIEIKPSQRYIYPIFKNASSAIIQWGQQQKYKTLFNEQIKRAPIIDVILRDPIQRTISGVNTLVWFLIEERPNLSKDTIFYFVENYPFLNRHYALQLSWIINLFRYTTEDTKFKFVGMENIIDYTPIHHPIQPEEMVLHPSIIDRIKNNRFFPNQHFLKLEQALFSVKDKDSWTRKQILTHLMNREPQAFFETIGKSNTIIGVTDVLS